MIDRFALGAPLLIGVSAVWLAIALAATIVGLRRARQGARARAEASAITDLLAGAPAVPMLVYPDDRIDADPRIAGWLGLDTVPQRLAELGGAEGIVGADLDALVAAVAETRSTGGAIERTLALHGSSRMLGLRGAPYTPPGFDVRAVLLWFVDISEQQHEVERLRTQADALGGEVATLSALIDAAPFPIWRRAPDLGLALVNRAYVRAIEAKSASDTIARGLELIETGTGASPQAIAAEARDRDSLSIRAAPAIVAGQRRMMRVIDAPIGAAGVAGFAIDIQALEDARADLGLFVRAQRAMLDRLSSGVAQFAADRAMVFHNRHFARLFAMEPEWLADRPDFDRVLERMRESQHVPESRDFPGWKAERRSWFSTTEPIEESWLLPGGTHLRVVAQPLPDRGLLLIFEDRTEHLRLTSARDTLLRVRAAIFENLFEAVGVFTADGRLNAWNDRFRAVWDLDEAALTGQPHVDALLPMIAPQLRDPSRVGLIRELVRIATFDRQHRAGQIGLHDGRQFDFNVAPLPDGNALFTLLDVTGCGIGDALGAPGSAIGDVQ